MNDVARLARVSYQTVSRVLNDHENVAAATRARVLAAIEELDYRPSAAARSLVTGRSRTLGILTLDFSVYGPMATLYGAERAAREAGYFVSIVSVGAMEKALFQKAIAHLLALRVEGVVVMAPISGTSEAAAELPRSVPVVVLEGEEDVAGATVAVDQYAGAKAVTEHLLDLGHEQVAHVSGAMEWLGAARARMAGWRAALAEAGLAEPPLVHGDFTAGSGYEAGARLAAMAKVTSVFAANDQMALGVLGALQRAGRRVPEDVSVVGFGDIPESAFLIPPLTTVRQDFERVGARGVDLLVELIGSRRGAPREVLEPELVVRESTAAPSRRRRG